MLGNKRYSPEVLRSVEYWRAALLPGWEILMVDAQDSDATNSAAEIYWHDHRFIAELWLSDSVLQGPALQRRATIIHEMLHPLCRELRMEFMPSIDLDPEGHERWVHLEELLIERVSLAVGDPHNGGVRCAS